MRPRRSLNPVLIGDADSPPEELRRDRNLRVRLTTTELESLRFLADCRGMNVSEWIRHCTELHLTAREKARALRDQSEAYSARVAAFAKKHPFEIEEDHEPA